MSVFFIAEFTVFNKMFFTISVSCILYTKYQKSDLLIANELINRHDFTMII